MPDPEPAGVSADPPPDDGVVAESWDPTGLEMARSVAAQIAAQAAPGPGGGTGIPGRGRASRSLSRSARSGGRGSAGRDRDTLRSGAAPDDRDPQLLDRTIERLVADHGWATDVAVAGALSRWEQIVGPEVAGHCCAESYTDAELTVRADSTAWATQVRLLAPSVIQRLNEELGDGTVRRIHVLAPSAPSWGHGRRRVRDGRGPRDTYG